MRLKFYWNNPREVLKTPMPLRNSLSQCMFAGNPMSEPQRAVQWPLIWYRKSLRTSPMTFKVHARRLWNSWSARKKLCLSDGFKSFFVATFFIFCLLRGAICWCAEIFRNILLDFVTRQAEVEQGISENKGKCAKIVRAVVDNEISRDIKFYIKLLTNFLRLSYLFND